MNKYKMKEDYIMEINGRTEGSDEIKIDNRRVSFNEEKQFRRHKNKRFDNDCEERD